MSRSRSAATIDPLTYGRCRAIPLRAARTSCPQHAAATKRSELKPPSPSRSLVVQVRREPALDRLDLHSLPATIVFHLVAFQLPHVEIARLRVREVEAGH